jgi:hypothetical protein
MNARVTLVPIRVYRKTKPIGSLSNLNYLEPWVASGLARWAVPASSGGPTLERPVERNDKRRLPFSNSVNSR